MTHKVLTPIISGLLLCAVQAMALDGLSYWGLMTGEELDLELEES